MRTTIFATLTLLLLGAISLIIYGSIRPRVQTYHGKLADLLPTAPQGWTRSLRPIADTPEMQKAVGELLNYDDGVFADYTHGVHRLSVYIAYWTPGKMSHRLVAIHTPDVCWVRAGWKCTQRGTSALKLFGNPTTLLITTPGGEYPTHHSSFPVAEFRTFTMNGSTEYVCFWHIVGNRPKAYGTGAEPPWYASFTDLIRGGLNQREEQFFIRLSSSSTLDDSALLPVIESLMLSLPKTIVDRESASSEN